MTDKKQRHGSGWFDSKDWGQTLALAILLLIIGVMALNLLPSKPDYTRENHANILVLIADDLGVDWSPCYSDRLDLPNLTKLCDRSLIFDRAYTNSICTPSRASMLTGRHTIRHGAQNVHQLPDAPPVRRLPLSETIIPEVLDQIPDVEYAHGVFGKWHLQDTFNGLVDSPNKAGFQDFYGSFTRNGSFSYAYYNWPKVVNGKHMGKSKKYKTTAIVDDTIAWLETKKDQPWFAWIGFYLPHIPWHLPPLELHSYKDLDPNPPVWTKEKIPQFDELKARYFGAMMQALDTEAGRLLDYVDANYPDNTYIIFIGDNGTQREVALAPRNLGRKFGKGSLYDSGTHVPLMITGPDIRNPDKRVDSLVNSTDLFATVLELAGGRETLERLNLNTDSVSLVPIIKDRADISAPGSGYKHRNYVVTEAGTNNMELVVHTVFDGRLKLWIRPSRLEFYDLKKDFYEQTNIMEKLDPMDHQSEIVDMFQFFLDIYLEEEDPYTEIVPEVLIQKYRKLLCSGETKVSLCK